MTHDESDRGAGVAAVHGRPARWLNTLSGIGPHGIDRTLAGVTLALWRRKRVVIALAIIGALAAFLTASLLERKYVAHMQLVPNTEDQSGGSLGRLASLGSLGNLAGGLTKPERVSPFQQYLAMMTSLEVAREMERRGQFLARLFPELWDEKAQAWRPPRTGFIAKSKLLVKRALGLPTPPHPTEENLANEIARRVGVTDNDENSIYVISFTHKDPVFARQFIQALYDSTEAVLLRRDHEMATRKVRVAEQELGKTTITASRDALAEIMITLNLRLIQTNVGSPYAAQILSAAEVSDFPSYPDVLAFIVFGFMGGLFLGALVVSTVALARGRKSP